MTAGPQMLTMPRYDETVKHLEEILVEVKQGKHGKEPRMMA